MFKVGELVVHGGEGVCQVAAIGYLRFPFIDHERLYYTLSPLYREGKLYVPVDGDVFIRPIITREQAQALIAQIPQLQSVALVDHQNKRFLCEQYQKYIKSHTCADWLQLIKIVNTKREIRSCQSKKLGSIDERFLQQAEDMLYGEFAVALDIPKDKVQNYIEKSVNQCMAELHPVSYAKERDYYAVNQ